MIYEQERPIHTPYSVYDAIKDLDAELGGIVKDNEAVKEILETLVFEHRREERNFIG